MNIAIKEVNKWIANRMIDKDYSIPLNLINLGLNELPILPEKLEVLYCEKNNLVSLDNLPISLKRLDCGNNKISSLDYLPINLIKLNCNNNNIVSLDNLPLNLRELKCQYTQITKLQILPINLQTLDCSNNNLVSLDNLPTNLQALNCGYNNLILLDKLPSTLQILYCNNNKLVLLDKLPLVIWKLNCNHNNITSLNNLPPFLKELHCNFNNITLLNNLPPFLKTLFCFDNPLNFPITIPETVIDTDLEPDQYVKTINLSIDYFQNFKTNFDLFYRENFEKCFMNPTDTYPISNSKLMIWLKSVIEISTDKCNQSIALYFSKCFTHISFTSFYEQLRKISMDMLIKIQDTNPKYVILVIGGRSVKKSNLWVSLLSWKFLKDKITHVIDTEHTFDLYKGLQGTTTQGEDILFIHPDDCSYTGTQILNLDGKTNGINTNILELQSKVNYYIFCPYLSFNSTRLFTQYYLKYPDNSIIFDTIENNMKYENKKCKTNYKIDKYAIYFDHKLADGVSIFEDIIRYGSIPWDGYKIGNSLIHNCDNIREVCPPSFYKNIDYTINGKKLKGDRIIDILKDI